MTEEKPATDRRIERARVALSKEHYTERLWHSDFVKALIARIDTERTVRLAAEARVGVLTEALRAFIAAHDFAGAESWDCTGETRQRFEHAASAAKLLLEEPANG